MASLTTADSAPIGTFESSGVYAGGHLFFMRGGNLMMQALSEETLKLEGEPVSLGVQVRRDSVVGARFSVSTNGRLAFLPPPSTQAELTWLDRRGRPLGIVGEPGVYGNLDLSPDGRKLAVARLMPRPSIGNQTDIWVIDLATDTATPLTDDPGNEYDPAWSPDGKHIVFNSGAVGLSASLFTRASDGSGADVPLAKSGPASFVAAWSRADVIIFNARTKDKAADLMTLRWPGDSTPEVFVSTQHSELNGTFSPDGRWVAYQSDASRRYEVLVRPFPDKDPVRTISRAGGMYPRWRGDGEELFFVAPDGTMMAADFDPAIGLAKGVPRPLFPTQISVGDNRPYVVDNAGERFLLPIKPEPKLTAVMDWRALVRR